MSKLREAIEAGVRDARIGPGTGEHLLSTLDAHEAAEAQRWAEVRALLEGGLQMMPLKGSAGVNSIESALALIPPAPAVEPLPRSAQAPYTNDRHAISSMGGFSMLLGRALALIPPAPAVEAYSFEKGMAGPLGRMPPEKCERCRGSGWAVDPKCNDIRGDSHMQCPDCGGSGERR